jgi:hypothetical protein
MSRYERSITEAKADALTPDRIDELKAYLTGKGITLEPGEISVQNRPTVSLVVYSDIDPMSAIDEWQPAPTQQQQASTSLTTLRQFQAAIDNNQTPTTAQTQRALYETINVLKWLAKRLGAN